MDNLPDAPSHNRILVVEDDSRLADMLSDYLQHEGYQVEVARDGLAGLERALSDPPSLILLDWMLPDIEGPQFIRRLRREQLVPLIMLTVRSDESDVVLGLELGADDYVTKPFSLRVLGSRIRAVLRRDRQLETSRERVVRGPITLDPLSYRMTYNEDEIELTPREFDLMYTLARQPERVFRRGELLELVWGSDYGGSDRVVDLYISRLRRKLRGKTAELNLLYTVHGVGYKFAKTHPL